MTEVTENELNATQQAFKDKLNRFRAETRLSVASTSTLMDVSQGAMAKWFLPNPSTGRVRLPANYIMISVESKIDRLNEADRDTGLYSHLRGLKPNERVALLQGVLEGSSSV